jgi:hypothetical protein
MKTVILICCLSSFLINEGMSQLTINISTNKDIYEYGEAIILTGILTNNADSSITVIGNYQGFFFPLYFNDIVLQMTHIPNEISYEFPPRSSYTSVYTLDPIRLGLPNKDDLQHISCQFRWRLIPGIESISIMDTVTISAPAFEGGQLLIAYSIDTPASDIEALRDSMNATVLLSDTLTFINTISELWQTTGFIIDSLIAHYQNDPRLLSLYADREIYLDSLFVTNVKDHTLYPTDYTLHHNFPNPFNPTTTIRYDLPRRAYVSLTIYNILGQKVESLVNREQEIGKYEVVWNAARMPGGVYYYQLITDEFVGTKKMVLLQ